MPKHSANANIKKQEVSEIKIQPKFESEKEIVDKGGSFKNKDDLCSITTEDCSDKNSKYSNLGIRLVRGKISDIDIKAGEEIAKRKKEKNQFAALF